MARLLVIMFGTLALGQSSFEVASVKAADPKERNVDFRIQPGGRLTVVKDTLQGMITMAFSVKRYQLKGGPGWLVTDRFNIEARADGNPDRAAMLILFRNLLRERFGLQVHREAREGTIYALTEAKSGHRFKSSRESESQLQLRRNTPRDLPGVSYTIVARKVSMDRFAASLVGQLDSPVANQSGLPGEFDFELDFAIDDKPESGPSIFTAIQEQLGLKLVAVKGPVEVLVVDRAEKPVGN